MPAFPEDMVPQLALQEHCPGVWTPWTPEIDSRRLFIVYEAAVAEHIAPFLAAWRGSSCDIAVFLTHYHAVLKPCGRKPEDEVSRTFYPAVPEELALSRTESVDRVLVRDETAIDEGHPVPVDRYGAGRGETECDHCTYR